MAGLSGEEKVKVDALFAEPISTGHDLQYVAQFRLRPAANNREEDAGNPSGRMVWGQMVAD